MPGWLKWGGIGCLGLITLVFVLPFLGPMFANSFWTFVVCLVLLFVVAGVAGGDESDGEGQDEGTSEDDNQTREEVRVARGRAILRTRAALWLRHRCGRHPHGGSTHLRRDGHGEGYKQGGDRWARDRLGTGGGNRA